MESQAILTDLAVIFIAAKLAAALFNRLGQPAVIGELLAGIVLGPHLLGAIGESHTHEIFQELGAIILLFAVGLDTPLSELKAVGGRSLSVGVAGIVIPFAAGTGLMLALGESGPESLFIGTALVATSVGVTARVLADLGQTRAPESRVILGAAVVDDVLGLLVLAVVAGSVAGNITPLGIFLLALLAVTFVILVGGLGATLVGRAQPFLDRMGHEAVFLVALGLCLALSAIAGILQLAAIIGAFLAGMAFAETRDHYDLEERLGPVYALLVPFFFVVTGSFVDLSVFADAGTAWLTVIVIVVAVAGKLLGCGAAAWGLGRRGAAIVGMGMVPRGEVGILVATIGLSQGVIEGELYAVVVAMSVITTLIAPPALSSLFGVKGRHRGGPRQPEIEGVGG